MSRNIIEINSLSFRYGRKEKYALQKIRLCIREGEIFGLLGTNGAGKTTLIHILSTILSRFDGTVLIDNIDLRKNPEKIREKIGILFQNTVLDEELTAYQNMDFYATLHGVPDKKKVISELLTWVDLKNEMNKRVETFSLGMKRRLELARCFLVKPKILLLDEPTANLDALMKRKIWSYLKKLTVDLNCTIILATHDVREVEVLCDGFTILNKGNLLLTKTFSKQKTKEKNTKLPYSHLEDLFIKCVESVK